MNKISYFPLYHFYFKYIGLLASLAGLGLSLFLNPQYQLLIYTGNLIIIFSKEKNESEFTGLVRAESFKSVFGFTLSLAIALQLTEAISSGFRIEWSPFLVIGLPLCFYLILFYFTLAFRIRVNHSLDLTQNLVNHRRFYLVWFLIILLISGVFIILIIQQ